MTVLLYFLKIFGLRFVKYLNVFSFLFSADWWKKNWLVVLISLLVVIGVWKWNDMRSTIEKQLNEITSLKEKKSSLEERLVNFESVIKTQNADVENLAGIIEKQNSQIEGLAKKSKEIELKAKQAQENISKITKRSEEKILELMKRKDPTNCKEAMDFLKNYAKELNF